MASDSSSSPQTTQTAKTDPVSKTFGQQVRNLILVTVATVLTVAVVLGFQTQTPSASLSTLAEASVPLDTALVNGRPTLIEFYANWCTSCQAMAADMEDLRTDYGDAVNFVMLNVDNSKWLPEMLHYRVDGIPHFVYLDQGGETLGDAIGEMPRAILAENLEALVAQAPLPHANTSGMASSLGPQGIAPSRSDDPRSHGAQVAP